MLERLRRVGADIASLAGLRAELFGIELREQFDHWLRVAALVVCTLVLGCIGLGFFAVLVTVAFWDQHPLMVLALFAALFLGAAAWCLRRLSAAVVQAPEPFSATIAEFRRDRESIGPSAPGGGTPGP